MNCMRSTKDHTITSHWFRIKYIEENGSDGGGLRRNWVLKMLMAMSDPRRNFMKTFKTYKIPALFVHPQVFYGIGRLIGKALTIKTGLPYQFHPNLVGLLKNPEDEELFEKLFKEWYEEELEELDQKLTMAVEGGPESISETGLVPVKYWRLTDCDCPHTIATTMMAAILQGCPVPIKPNGRKITLEQYMTKTDQSKSASIYAVELSSLTEPYLFQPKTVEEVKEFVEDAKEKAREYFKASILDLREGLHCFLDVEMLRFMKTSVIEALISPVIEIDLQDLINAFSLQQAEKLSVEVLDPEKVSESYSKFCYKSERSGRILMEMATAFAYAIEQLTKEELQGFLAQLTGSRSPGIGGFKPGQFIAMFSRTRVKRGFIETSQPCPNNSSLLAEADMKTPNVELPFTSSWYQNIYLILITS